MSDEQEQEEILEEIEGIGITSSLPVSEGIEKLKSQKSGIGFPLLINLFAIAAVLSTFYFSNRLFEQKKESLRIENTTYQSAEGKIIEALKKESAAQIEKKDQEIGIIQVELAELDRQSRLLAATMNQQIADREAELRLTLEAELAEERLKLKSQGKSENAIELELARIEEQRNTEFEAELASFRTDAKAAIAAKEEELSLAKQLNEEMLAGINSEKARIQDQTKKRETELTAQFETEKTTLAEEAAAAEAELKQLADNQSRESLIIDQINSLYRSIFASIDNKNFEQASLQINSLQQLLEDPKIAPLKAVNSRSRNDQDIIVLLEQKIEEQSFRGAADTKSLAAAAELLLSAQEIADLGTAAYEEGRTQAAEDYYNRAIEKLPFIRKAWINLENISAEAETELLSEYIRKGTELSNENRHAEAIQQFRLAAESAATADPDLLTGALSGIIIAADKLRESELSERDLRFTSLGEQSTADRQVMEQKLKEAENAYRNLEMKKTVENERLTRMIGERDQENLRLNSEKEEISESLSALKAETAQLQDELTGFKLKYQELNSSFQREQEVAEFSNGIKQGRVDAFTDIIEIASYLDGSSTFNSDDELRIMELASNETVYGEAVRKLQKLAAADGVFSSGKILPAEQSILIGSISFASGNEIVIEPLSDELLEQGTQIKIYRKERNKDEYYIMSGIVTTATENKITARTESDGTFQARSMDLVYITK